ncbi:hypothetical protein FKW77_008774 [Venturia effusa]|uniref:Heterokaryon incompatibility domain-containing protein n=1 Tax=Venturia effusa TaxID=50376 RepID=A0A517LCR9_9PEZI|nr:hypothetical protein FKW77_008774 [Venturia effusa]
MRSDTPTGLYKHTTLPGSSIRLLKFQPDSQPGDIRFNMEVHDIDSCPPYTVLSYTWGESGNERRIKIEGEWFPIRQNLACFLDTEILKRDQGLENHVGDLFWIDHICINQSNSDERGRQVSMMRQIYTGAELVLAWLGEASDDSDLAMGMFECHESYQGSPVGGWTVNEHAMAGFTDRPYWYRIWVIQELLLARRLAILCRSRKVNLTPDVTEGILSLGRRFPGPFSLVERILHLRSHDDQRRLFDMMLISHQHIASEPEDKVFGLLGLATNEDGVVPSYQVDYNQSAEEIIDSLYKTYLAPGEPVNPVSEYLNS